MRNLLRPWWTLGLLGVFTLALPVLPACTSGDDDDDASSPGDDDDDDSSTPGDDDDDTTNPGDDDDDDVVSIESLNTDPPADETVVTTRGIVTGITYENDFWIQEAEGGEYTGIYIFAENAYRDTTPPFVAGDEVEVQGEFSVFFNLREISVYSDNGYVSVTQAGAGMPDPLEIQSLDELQGDGGCDLYEQPDEAMEPYVGLLVKLPVATVDDALGACGTEDRFGYWSVATEDGGVILVDDDIEYEYEPTEGDTVQITGIITYSFEQYKIVPIGDDGIVPVDE